MCICLYLTSGMRLLPCPKTKFEFEWRRSWDHEDMCLISYLYSKSKKICALSLHFWIVILEIQGEIHGLSLMRQLLIFLCKQGKLSPIKSYVKLELCSKFEYKVRLWYLTHECSLILTSFCLHMEHLNLPSFVLLDRSSTMCENYLFSQIKIYLFFQHYF